MSWSSFKLPSLPSGVASFGSQLQAATAALTTLLQAVKAAVQVIAAVDTASASVAQAAVQAAVSALQSAIESLVKDTGVYVLLVPVRRQVVVPEIVQSALSSAGLSTLPTPSVPQPVAKLLANLTPTPFVSSVAGADGGNAGFLRTVVESLVDDGDANRPQFDETAAVAGVVMLAGADDYLSLQDFASTISGLIAAKEPATALDMPDIPSPQNLRARIASAPQTGAPSVFLEWDYAPPVSSVPSLGDLTVKITNVAVVRSKNPALLSKSSALDCFNSKTLSSGMKIGSASKTIEVVDVVPYSVTSLRNFYYDTSADPTTTYYYAVCYQTSAGTATDVFKGSAKDQGFGKFSGVCKVAKRASPARSAKSSPPDWVRTPTVIDLIPQLGLLLRQLEGVLGGLASTTGGYADMLNSYAKFIDQEVTSFSDTVDNINAQISGLTSLLGAQVPGGVYFRTFSGTGGNAFLVEDLASALTGDDATRPPFDSGDEYTMGFVILAGAESASALAPVTAMLNTLFSAGSSAASSMSQAVAAIKQAVVAAEQQAFNANFTIAASSTDTTPQKSPQVGSDTSNPDPNC